MSLQEINTMYFFRGHLSIPQMIFNRLQNKLTYFVTNAEKWSKKIHIRISLAFL